MENVNTKQSRKLFYFLLSLVLLRPSLDITSQIEFQIHPSLPLMNPNIIIGGLVFLISLLFYFKNLKNIHAIPLFYPIFLTIGLFLISIFYSVNAFASIREFIRFSAIFLLYFLAYWLIENRKDFYLLLKAIIISYFLPSLVALVQLVFGLGLPDDFGGFKRIYGTFAHPNPFAFYTFFIVGLTLCLLLSLQQSKKDDQIKKYFPYFWLFAGLAIFLLFATYTRSAIACLFIFMAIFGIFKYRKILLMGVLLFFFAYFFSDVFQERLWEMITLDPYGSIIWRFRLWRDIIPISLWQPWFGYGAGTFTKIVEFYRGFRWGSLDAHNDYLKIFMENGLAGLVAYGWLILGLFSYLFKIFKKSIDQDKVLTLGILAISLSLFMIASVDNVLRGTALQWNFWILIAGWFKLKA
ncbi:MAG: hypothetical protein CMI55_00495 [Parcubacteria group bacterium]|jgi:O-antigen ligase|nr:hypothetical protein [Parcubacteria group bacterium]|tara:strand:- start:5820 stop:7046 length:1227 start_codon:yes stop_codon:yes gene_type:complete